ncbi:hypothetical protein B0H21DRAFT_885240 [Amylocystis lapponica]|nr:hypothetical protein B0H21DRAFT_885240 [Amylocystis lapponica]
MGLAVYAIASRLFPAYHRDRDRNTQPDPEKAQSRSRIVRSRGKARHRELVDGQGVNGQEDDDLHDNVSASLSWNPLRRRHRTPTRSNASERSPTITTASSTSWLSRARSVIFPSGDRHAEIEKFVPNYRSSPIISGIVIPFSILLEIPGLTERWYVRTENNQTVDTKANPVILDVGMALSIACALLANISLVLRFLEKKVKITTISCICFLTLHDIINITTVTIFGVQHRYDDGFTYGQSFWMTLCSTVASTITNCNLIYDYIRVPDFANSAVSNKSPGSGLTRRQRALVIIVILLLLYIALGALVNSLLLNLSYIDGLYFTTVSIETIGFGDITPDSTGSRVFICAYIATGIVLIGVAIALMRETVLEGLEIGYRRRLRNMRTRRREARRFRRWEARWRDAVEWRLRAQGAPVWVPDQRPDADDDDDDEGALRFVGLGGTAGEHGRLRRFVRALTGSHMPPADPAARPQGHVRGHPRGQHLNINVLSHAQLQAAALEAGVPLGMFVDSGVEQRVPSGGAGPGDAFAGVGWPTEAQTPTHAQIGRIAAMVTKFAVGHSGREMYFPGMGDRTARQSEDSEQEEAEEAGEGDARIAAAGREAGREHGSNVHQGKGTLADIGRYARVPKWVREFAHGENQKAAFSYDRYQEAVESEEKKAYISKLTVAWSLFFVFWFVGSGIFSATEGWPFGIAMYFCFMAFVTTGYGDYAPVTPAGRSIFVVWALFGVATMTILISILQDVGELRYKSALHSRVFDTAVKKYRKKQAQESARIPRAHSRLQNVSRLTQAIVGQSDDDGTAPSPVDVGASRDVARRELEALPGKIIQHARTFHDYMQYFVDARGSRHPPDSAGAETGMGMGTDVPGELRHLLDDIAEGEHIGERVKREILQDEDAKNTLFMLSIEHALRKMIQAAEQTLAALAERDALVALQEQQRRAASGGRGGEDNPDAEELSEELRSIRDNLDPVPSPARSMHESTPDTNSSSPHASTSGARTPIRSRS